MSSRKEALTSLETGENLRKKTNDELVSAILYKQIIGSLRYLFITRSYICQSVGLLSRSTEKPQECHLTAVKGMMSYIKGKIDHGVLMSRKKKTSVDAEVYCYTDSDFSGDQDMKKSNVCYIFMIVGAPISWSSGKQGIVALSSCEAKYVTASYATCQVAWIKMSLEDLKIMETEKKEVVCRQQVSYRLGESSSVSWSK
ncbi:secreted RxLR effector protein 161-like [Lathyrus oleraceus]|uniref:secreted RxLR effector protein 161-like n=1 Tax=Pisum sativum TaxID=3888 RepID=UPI0021D0DAE1|nr:secreted RxLR effector protein 161-like [Pisum sativum]